MNTDMRNTIKSLLNEQCLVQLPFLTIQVSCHHNIQRENKRQYSSVDARCWC